jgi:ribosomal-protein-alanine N-acetyltransferase
MIGTCGFAKIDSENNLAELGYVLNPRYLHQGYATEAARSVIKFGFEELLLNRIEARFMEENIESLRVMERLGMTFEGFRRKAVLIKGKYETVGICSILKSEYENQKSECL